MILPQNRESNQKGHSFDLVVRADSCLHTPASARPPSSWVVKSEDFTINNNHCEGSRGLGLGFGLGLGRRLGLGFNSFQSFKSTFCKTLFPVILGVFLLTKQR